MPTSHWAWGPEPEESELREIARLFSEHTGLGDPVAWEPPVPFSPALLPAPRLDVPPLPFCTADPFERAVRTYGQAYRDLIRAYRGDFANAPDLVALPENEDDIERALEWASGHGVAVVPRGGGTSVVGGVESRFDGPSLCLDLRRMNRIVEVDETSQAALVEAGATGPEINAGLPEGLQLRFFPQSYEFSTLGGWIATRAGGHFATLHTHIDDLVESVRAVAPAGAWESRRLPGSGAGPSPDRWLLGSEGALGVITRAWIRVHRRPVHKVSVPVRFTEWVAGVSAVHDLAQSGLHPSNCRLLDAREAALTSGGDGRNPVLIIGFESADHPVDAWMSRALEIVAWHGGVAGEARQDQAWKGAFTRMPYLRNAYPGLGVLAETVETAVTWDRFMALHEAVMAEHEGTTCRLAFVYPDGPAPYYTIVVPAVKGGELEQWDDLKRRLSETVLRMGGTITHHHAVGRDHRPFYDRQRPDPFALALKAAKTALDPAGLLNPGVLI
ncbi:alkyldihydroxyacetonephosphate synthase [Nonomuraea solani]|uniref:Alkyldihydroxyacetonephosphate synthase n=1 Tax=Nonomuraea solani TaxID=1144553 RepID=A0A1H6F0X0_9ACTN|nr:FAD-binding oxidoreductase [Nonomuraea solani]SEH02809.1 alkyldihydroxyacetonephosphate synthase [Nonomuraea solani]